MKTVCKKLLSLMLVAVLLVSAVPMMASAASSTPVWVIVKEGTADSSSEVTSFNTEYVANSTTISGMMAAAGQYEVTTNFVKASYKKDDKTTPIGADEALPEGVDGIYVVYEPKAAVQPPEDPTEAVVAPISITVKVNNSDNVVWTGSKVPANGKSSLVKDLLSYVWSSDWDNAYTFHHAWVSERQTNLGQNDKVYAGETLYIALENKTTSGNGGSGSGSGSGSGIDGAYNSVFLHIYSYGSVKSAIKDIKLDTWSCVKDGVLSLREMSDVVKTYYSAKNSDGITIKGFYLTKDDMVAVKNDSTSINNLEDMRRKGEVHLYITIDNYTTKSSSSSNADSSNPKTGDSIYTAVAVMGLSVTALAAVYFINKKRIAY